MEEIEEMDDYTRSALALIKDCAERWETLRREPEIQNINNIFAAVKLWRTDAQQVLQPLGEHLVEEILPQPLPRLRSHHLRRDSLVKRGFRQKVHSSSNRTRTQTSSNRQLSSRLSSPLFVTDEDSEPEAVDSMLIVDGEETSGKSSGVESDAEMEQPGYEDMNFLAGMSGDIEMHRDEDGILVDNRVEGLVQSLDTGDEGNYSYPIGLSTNDRTAVVESAEDQTIENSDDYETNALFNEAFYLMHGSQSPLPLVEDDPTIDQEAIFVNEFPSTLSPVEDSITEVVGPAGEDTTLEDSDDYETNALFNEAFYLLHGSQSPLPLVEDDPTIDQEAIFVNEFPSTLSPVEDSITEVVGPTGEDTTLEDSDDYETNALFNEAFYLLHGSQSPLFLVEDETGASPIENHTNSDSYAQFNEAARFLDKFSNTFTQVDDNITEVDSASEGQTHQKNNDYEMDQSPLPLEEETGTLSQTLQNSESHNGAVHFIDETSGALSLVVNSITNKVAEPATANQGLVHNESFEMVIDGFQSPLSALEDEISARRPLSTDSNVEDATHSVTPISKIGSAQTVMEHYLSIASDSCSRFHLPHEYLTPQEMSEETPQEPRILLSPLLCDEPLTPRLIHGLLFRLIPAPVHILELPPDDSNMHVLGISNFVVIECQHPVPLLILGVASRKEITVLGPENLHCTFVETFCVLHPDWAHTYRDPVCSNVEPTLSSVYLAEITFKNLPITTPSQEDLQSRFLLELLPPYERNYVLQQFGIPVSENKGLHQKLEPLSTLGGNFGMPYTTPDTTPVGTGFDNDMLEKAMSQKPKGISWERTIRILQCIREIGHPLVLDRLRLDLNKPLQMEPDTSSNIEMLLHIHSYLDKQASKAQISVARSRYLKYCYFETYQMAVDALTVEKRLGRIEKKDATRRKTTTTYKEGLKELPAMPANNSIDAHYSNLTEAERSKRAADIVKIAIVHGIHDNCGEDEVDIRRRITIYLRQGKIMHFVLQGSRSLSPGLLLLFPGEAESIPSLNISGVRIGDRERDRLCKAIKVQDIDGLNEEEAHWFGMTLQLLRPDLLEQVPKPVFELLSNPFSESRAITRRDPKLYKEKPLQFFAL